MKLSHIDHVQLAIPKGGEARAAAFYGKVLGLQEVEKPPLMRASGGVWFANETINIHLGVDPDFCAAKKAHPAFRVEDLETLAARLRVAGFNVKWDERMPNTKRFYSDDPYGNRLEFMALAPH